jgi:hypothetical protein
LELGLVQVQEAPMGQEASASLLESNGRILLSPTHCQMVELQSGQALILEVAFQRESGRFERGFQHLKGFLREVVRRLLASAEMLVSALPSMWMDLVVQLMQQLWLPMHLSTLEPM